MVGFCVRFVEELVIMAFVTMANLEHSRWAAFAHIGMTALISGEMTWRFSESSVQ